MCTVEVQGPVNQTPIATGVSKIVGLKTTMAGLRADGSVVVWEPDIGGLMTLSADLQEDVVSIHNYNNQFAVLKRDGSVFYRVIVSEVLVSQLGTFPKTLLTA